MTELISKTKRDTANIDRTDKALLWAILLLRQSILSSNNSLNSLSTGNPYKDWISVGHNLYNGSGSTREPIVFAKARLAYSSQYFLLNGGEFTESIISMTDLPSILFNDKFYSSLSKNITVEPSKVNTLEKYIYWLSLQLIKDKYLIDSDIQVRVNEENYPNNYFEVEATFPLISSSFFSGLPWVDCLSPIDVANLPVTDTQINNLVPMNNLSLIGN